MIFFTTPYNLILINNYMEWLNTNLNNLNKDDAVKLYHSLIIYRRKNILLKSDNQYIEKHHIIPKSICKHKIWCNSETNIINLSAAEHFIAHYLLYIIYPNNRSIIASLFAMMNWPGNKHLRDMFTNKDVLKLSLEFEDLRIKCRPIGQLNGNYGRKHTEDTKIKQSEKRKEYFRKNHKYAGFAIPGVSRSGINNGMTGKKLKDVMGEEEFNKWKERLKNRPKVSDETRKKLSEMRKGKKRGPNKTNIKRCWVHKNKEDIMIKIEDLNFYLSQGYLKGRIFKRRKRNENSGN